MKIPTRVSGRNKGVRSLRRAGGRRAAPAAVAGMAAVLAAAIAVTGCGGAEGGASTGGGDSEIAVVGYSTPQSVYEDGLEPAFEKTAAGKGVGFSNSFGASGDQSRAVESGQPASFVHFSVGTDMSRLVESGQVSPDWDKNEYRGIVADSVVVIVVRKGNPDDIHSFRDLVDKEVEVVTPNPFSSGSARWNIMAIYGAAINGGESPKQALDDVKTVLSKAEVQPASGRTATQAFTGGAGDVLLSYENEAIAARRAGEDIDYVVPDSTLLIETPAAVTVDAPAAARKFLEFAWSDAGQRIWAENGYRPVNRKLLDTATFPIPKGLFTLKQFGGWDEVADRFFDEKTGSIARIEEDLGVSTAG